MDTNRPTQHRTNAFDDLSSADAFVRPKPRRSILGRASNRVSQLRRSVLDRFILPEDNTGSVDILGYIATATPPWFVSLIVHFSLMILLGLAALGVHDATTKSEPIEIELSNAIREPKEEIFADRIGEQLDDPNQLISSDGPANVQDFAALSPNDLPLVDDPLRGPPVLDFSPDGTILGGTSPAPAIGLEFSGREMGMKKALLRAYGGTALTEAAVHNGLRWLAKQQNARGMWSLSGPYSDGIPFENNEAATAMALLAFQGAGYTPQGSKSDAFTRVVTRGWKALLISQQSDGRFAANMVNENHQLYTHAICTIAICELYGMTHDPLYFERAQKAVDYCVRVQAPEGGWRYQPGIDSDTSVTGWFAMALQSARMAGLEVPSPAYDRVGKFLDTVARANENGYDVGSRYAYQPRQGATLAISAEGLLCRQYLGWPRDDPRLVAGVEYIAENPPEWNKRNVYYWYYATQVLHHMEGKAWQDWNQEMRKMLPSHQEKRGRETGSWDPKGDRWASGGGRLYVTCLSLYILEVYYRHLPIYRDGILSD